ncbi:phage-related integrase [Bordetella ansorpii]|uniref:Phage-related integrase n=1 Tax=Bordetella ansorpii TaxID=288768 RepID=A0A157SR31_9BORD|nr:integrase arm-type DNA-binding domain-containing protein [Bordetella ansorpii]SAI72958.1 phage-related integrase [Bordetella ansorpii]
MPTNTLNDTQCRAARPGEKPYKLFDGGGLYLFVTPSGAKSWRLAYRFNLSSKTMTFGLYPEVTLAQARAQRDEAKAILRQGRDPGAEKAKPKEVETVLTFVKASDDYWDGREDISESYRANAKNAIRQHLVPQLGERDVRTITKQDLLGALNAMDAAGLLDYVRKTRMWVSQVFEYLLEQGKVESNPASQINPRKAFRRRKAQHMAALEQRDIPEFMARLALENPSLLSVIACEMLALTWTRTKELRMMKWEELEWEQALWRVPADNMKRGEYHLVPLSKQALRLLAQLRQRSRGSVYVFPHETRLDRPMSENTILFLMYRIGYKGRMTGHGWRSVASTWANERGYNPDAIERQLSHVPHDPVRAAYNRAAYLPQRQQLLQDWADWLKSCKPDAGVEQSGEAPALRLA